MKDGRRWNGFGPFRDEIVSSHDTIHSSHDSNPNFAATTTWHRRTILLFIYGNTRWSRLFLSGRIRLCLLVQSYRMHIFCPWILGACGWGLDTAPRDFLMLANHLDSRYHSVPATNATATPSLYLRLANAPDHRLALGMGWSPTTPL